MSGPLAVLGTGTVCSSEPQSLIAEYFIDCTPKGPPIQEGTGSPEERIESPDITVSNTRQTVQNDLVLSAARLPYRERLTLLINEFGTALAGNADNLNEAIRRGAPSLEETQKVFNVLADQASIIRDLNADSDQIITRLAERRNDVVDFIDNTKVVAEASAERRDDLGQNFAKLDDFLFELKPTMASLGTLAREQTPLLANLRRAAPGLGTLSRNLPDFNVSATDALVSLGKASVPGERALRNGRDEIQQLAKASKRSFSVADNLSKFLRDLDDPSRAVETDTRANRDTGRKGETGYTGFEGLLNYVYYQTGAINQYDEFGHLLHFSIFEVASGPCSEYNAGPTVPATGGGQTTNILEADRCVAWLGDNQPGINEPDTLEPYDSSVCPQGSNDLEICDPSGSTLANSDIKAKSAPADEEDPAADGTEGDTSEDGEDPAGEDGGGATGEDPDADGTAPSDGDEGSNPSTGIPGLDDVLDSDGTKQGRGGSTGAESAAMQDAAATQDLMGFLFGN